MTGMNILKDIKRTLNGYIDPEKAEVYPKFFKTGKGEYGEGDKFIGVTVPHIRKTVKDFYLKTGIKEIKEFLSQDVHEYRLFALLVLVSRFEKANDEKEKKVIFDFYLNNIDRINNWDLVDLSAPKIIGAFLLDKDKSILYKLAKSGNLWKERIAVLSTFCFIKESQFEDTFKISEIFITHKHDLIHKATGWMLREVGKRDMNALLNFLNKHYKQMPRTMLRYSIEKFEEKLRQKYLKS